MNSMNILLNFYFYNFFPNPRIKKIEVDFKDGKSTEVSCLLEIIILQDK